MPSNDPAQSRLYVDAHLDLAYNAVRGRDLTLPVDELRAREKRDNQEIMATLPELAQAGVRLVFATIFVMPRKYAPVDAPESFTYEGAQEAHERALEQLELYQRWEAQGRITIIRSSRDLERHLESAQSAPAGDGPGHAPVGVVLLMEGADPVRTPEELGWWWEQGVRILGLSWKETRYAGGTGVPGPLTDLGRQLLTQMQQLGMALDVSHLAPESFWQAVEGWSGPLLASHSNSRAFIDSDRHLDDDMVRALAQRDAMIGLVLANPFLKAGVSRQDPKASVTLEDVGAQARHIAAIAGWERVGIGSDFDGGFGLQETPQGLERAGDFHKLAGAFPEEAAQGVLAMNWLRWLRASLPNQ